MTVETGSPAVNVTGLLPGTNYMLRVVAVSVFGGVQAPSLPSLPINATTGTTGRMFHTCTIHAYLFQHDINSLSAKCGVY